MGNVTILFYNDDWGMIRRPLPVCPERCRVVFDPSLIDEADIVVFHIPTLEIPGTLRKRPGQRWVAWSMESYVNYPLLAEPKFMRLFDLTMTYRRDADVWTPYLSPPLVDELMAPPQRKNAPALAVYFASNERDRSGRKALVQSLMEHLTVDSFGRSLQNKILGNDQGRATKLATIAPYRFTLAFENSVDAGYVTEKFFDPLIAGSVPVYLGAPDVSDFAPGEHCYIDAADYPDAGALAAYLKELASDDAKYNAYLAWKQRPLRDSFVAMIERTRQHAVCRLGLL